MSFFLFLHLMIIDSEYPITCVGSRQRILHQQQTVRRKDYFKYRTGNLNNFKLIKFKDRIINSKSTLPSRAYAFAFPLDAEPAPGSNDCNGIHDQIGPLNTQHLENLFELGVADDLCLQPLLGGLTSASTYP